MMTEAEARMLFDTASAKAGQVTAMARIVMLAFENCDYDRKASRDTLWLMADLLGEQERRIEELQRFYLNRI